MNSPFELPRVVLLTGTDVAVEADHIRAGEPWAGCEIAGLQFYDYDRVGLNGEPIRPLAGDRLVLVRALGNVTDANAVEVWWRNDIHLGHLPRNLAAEVAPRMDAGLPLRAYVADPGTGQAWSARALLVGPAVGDYHAKWLAHVTNRIIADWRASETMIQERAERENRARGLRFEERLKRARASRLVQAVNTFIAKLPPEPIDPARLPPVGTSVELAAIVAALGCSRSTARRLAARTGARVEVHRRGHCAVRSDVVVTEALWDAMAERASWPRRRLTEFELL